MDGYERCDRICRPIGSSGTKVSTALYNRVYEAVNKLDDRTARALVRAIKEELSPSAREAPSEYEGAMRRALGGQRSTSPKDS